MSIHRRKNDQHSSRGTGLIRRRVLSVAAATALTASAATGVASAQDLPGSGNSDSGQTDNPTVSSIITSLTQTDVVGSLFSVVGSLTSGSLAAGSWQSVPGSETAG